MEAQPAGGHDGTGCGNVEICERQRHDPASTQRDRDQHDFGARQNVGARQLDVSCSCVREAHVRTATQNLPTSRRTHRAAQNVYPTAVVR